MMRTEKVFSRFCAVSFMVLSCLGCEKKSIENTAPTVDGGQHQSVFMPADSCELKGSAFDMEKNVVSYSWKKLSGPSGYALENADSLATKVRNLQLGEYLFELTVTDVHGLQGVDSAGVHVFPAGNHVVEFKNLHWGCPMGCSIVIENFYSFVPRTDSILVFIREHNSSSLTLVGTNVLAKYSYRIFDETLAIYSENPDSGEADIKIMTF
ncbi:MAG TPA: hypothetical protein VMY77_06295 [Chitinophagaceae bacterium]|nr:hypothetical protein [Chitinophagaceae bacterium]